MSKIIKEDCKTVSVYNLKEWGYLAPGSYRKTSVYWSNGEEKRGDISVEIDFRERNNLLVGLNYKIRHDEGEWKDVDQKFNILSTKCNYGGERYWFRCSLSRNGVCCGRRVAKLYLTPDYDFFGCRHCFNLTYEARNSGYTYSLFELDRYERNVAKKCYKGRITRKYKKYIKIQEAVLKDMARIGLC